MSLGALLVSLGLDAADFIDGMTKAERQTEKLVEATKRQASAIDRQIKGLEKQVAVLGMNTREQKLYELATKGATSAQLKQADAALRSVENYGKLQAAARGVGTVLGALGVGSFAAIAALFSSVVKGVDDLNDLKDATGASVENLSALQDVARRTGTEIDSVGTAVVKFNLALKDLKPDSDASRILKSLGLDAEELKRIDPAEALRQTAVALSQFADDGNKARVIQELFGKSVREIAPFLKDLAEKGSLVAKVTTQQAEEAEKYRKVIFGLQADMVDVARSIAGPFVTALNDASAAMKRARDEGGGTFAQIVAGQKAILGIGSAGKQTESDLASLQSRLAGVNEQLNQGALRDAHRNFLLKRQAALQLEVAAAQRAALGGGVSASFGGGKPTLIVPDKPDKPAKTPSRAAAAQSDVERYLDSLQKQIERTRDLSAVEQVLADIQAKRIKGIDAASAGQALDIAEQIDRRASQAEAEKLQLKHLKEFQDAQARIAEEGRRVFEATRTPAEQYGAEIERLNKLHKQGAIDAETYGRAVDQAVEALDRATKVTKEVAAETDTFTKRLQENVQDTLGQGLYDAMNGNFKNIGTAFVQMVNRMVAEALAADLARKLFGEKGAGGGSGGGGWIDTLFSVGMSMFGGGGGGINGGSILPNSLRGGAATGSNYIERDMLTILHKGEAVIPAKYNAGGGRPVNVVNNFTVSGSVDRRSQAQIAAAAGQGVNRALSRDE